MAKLQVSIAYILSKAQTRYLSRSAAQRYALSLGVSGQELRSCLSRNSRLARRAKLQAYIALTLLQAQTRYLSRLAYFTDNNSATAVCVVQAGLPGLVGIEKKMWLIYSGTYRVDGAEEVLLVWALA
jgi:hypothetical protein